MLLQILNTFITSRSANFNLFKSLLIFFQLTTLQLLSLTSTEFSQNGSYNLNFFNQGLNQICACCTNAYKIKFKSQSQSESQWYKEDLDSEFEFPQNQNQIKKDFHIGILGRSIQQQRHPHWSGEKETLTSDSSSGLNALRQRQPFLIQFLEKVVKLGFFDPKTYDEYGTYKNIHVHLISDTSKYDADSESDSLSNYPNSNNIEKFIRLPYSGNQNENHLNIDPNDIVPNSTVEKEIIVRRPSYIRGKKKIVIQKTIRLRSKYVKNGLLRLKNKVQEQYLLNNSTTSIQNSESDRLSLDDEVFLLLDNNYSNIDLVVKKLWEKIKTNLPYDSEFQCFENFENLIQSKLKDANDKKIKIRATAIDIVVAADVSDYKSKDANTKTYQQRLRFSLNLTLHLNECFSAHNDIKPIDISFNLEEDPQNGKYYDSESESELDSFPFYVNTTNLMKVKQQVSGNQGKYHGKKYKRQKLNHIANQQNSATNGKTKSQSETTITQIGQRIKTDSFDNDCTQSMDNSQQSSESGLGSYTSSITFSRTSSNDTLQDTSQPSDQQVHETDQHLTPLMQQIQYRISNPELSYLYAWQSDSFAARLEVSNFDYQKMEDVIDVYDDIKITLHDHDHDHHYEPDCNTGDSLYHLYHNIDLLVNDFEGFKIVSTTKSMMMLDKALEYYLKPGPALWTSQAILSYPILGPPSSLTNNIESNSEESYTFNSFYIQDKRIRATPSDFDDNLNNYILPGTRFNQILIQNQKIRNMLLFESKYRTVIRYENHRSIDDTLMVLHGGFDVSKNSIGVMVLEKI